jgi:PKHD-type hydroxylase
VKYSYFYNKNFLNKERILHLNKFIKKNFDLLEPEENAAVNENKNKKKFLSECKQIYWKKIKHLLEDVNQLVHYTNENNFGYDLYNIKDKDFINYNVYSSKDKNRYDWHCDGNKSNFLDCKLTLLINLSTEKYEGGKFKIFEQDEIDINELDSPGDILIFKSYLNHKVTPIIKGKRTTLAIFYNGPLLR